MIEYHSCFVRYAYTYSLLIVWINLCACEVAGACMAVSVCVCVYMHQSWAQEFACTLACWLISGCNLQAHSRILAPRALGVPEHWCPPAQPSASPLTHRWFGTEHTLGILPLQTELKHGSIKDVKTLVTHGISLYFQSVVPLVWSSDNHHPTLQIRPHYIDCLYNKSSNLNDVFFSWMLIWPIEGFVERSRPWQQAFGTREQNGRSLKITTKWPPPIRCLYL